MFKVNVDPTPSREFTEIEPFSCCIILWQMLNPRPWPYPFWLRLFGFFDLKDGLKIWSYSSSEIPIPLSTKSIYSSTSLVKANSLSLILMSMMSYGFENLRAFESRFITTCYMRRMSISRVTSSGSFSSLSFTSYSEAYYFSMSTMFSITLLIGYLARHS